MSKRRRARPLRSGHLSKARTQDSDASPCSSTACSSPHSAAGARFEAAAEDPAVIASLVLGPGHSSQARSLLLSDSCVAATRVFEHLQSPSYSKSEEDIQMLLKRSNGATRWPDPWRVGECC